MDNRFFRSLNYVRCGNRDADTIVFLHAAGLNLTWWDQPFSVLGHQFNLLAIDLPGHGRSGRLHDKSMLENLAESVADTLKNTVAGPVHIVGLSIGGMIAQLLAIGHPELVKSLFLAATQCTLSDDVREVMRRRAVRARSEGMRGPC
ncbi:alpha/beta fold hydrolase [Erwinia sp. D4-22]